MLFPRINWLKLYSFMLYLFTYHLNFPPFSGSSIMNTLNKSLIIATLIISTFISGINVDLGDGFFLFDKIRRQWWTEQLSIAEISCFTYRSGSTTTDRFCSKNPPPESQNADLSQRTWGWSPGTCCCHCFAAAGEKCRGPLPVGIGNLNLDLVRLEQNRMRCTDEYAA